MFMYVLYNGRMSIFHLHRDSIGGVFLKVLVVRNTYNLLLLGVHENICNLKVKRKNIFDEHNNLIETLYYDDAA